MGRKIAPRSSTARNRSCSDCIAGEPKIDERLVRAWGRTLPGTLSTVSSVSENATGFPDRIAWAKSADNAAGADAKATFHFGQSYERA
jgi:hypothetical protein